MRALIVDDDEGIPQDRSFHFTYQLQNGEMFENPLLDLL